MTASDSDPVSVEKSSSVIEEEGSIKTAHELDLKNPQNWSKTKKWTNFCVVFMNAFVGYFSSAVYMPATNDLRQYFNTNLTVSQHGVNAARLTVYDIIR
ncbi:hypothetical protein BCR43DRAFT_295381 [Syncephalastrum racemosum]|uniref:Major facilitator superfamily (MFS) profile domain-containing protein n=1 Tax=Syncephalastrum racemosum TaxID=13706 RepID=A0A1X2H988_SYNRA|nr:hypothetical protein BCR43DRAFT_295381 [Syncephalastrum racemosum]